VTLDGLKEDAVREFKDWLIENPDNDEPHDVIFEIADSNVPIYTADILELGGNHWELMTEVPELGPAFDGAPTPLNIIAANIFEAIEQACWECWREYEDADEDERTDLLREWRE